MALSIYTDPDHVPLLVTAHFLTGIGYDPPYGLDFAGIIAARMRGIDRAAMAEHGHLGVLPDTVGPEPDDMNMPLGRCTTGDDWHWLASCGIAVDALPDPEPRTFYRMMDTSWMQRAAQRPLPYHHPSKGPYRDVMMPSPVVICRAMQWQVVGTPSEVHRLVHGIRYLGRRRSTGEGAILSWTVESVDADPGVWAHAVGDEIIRPCPVECAEALGIEYRIGSYAIRPPSWHPERLSELAMTKENDDDWDW